MLLVPNRMFRGTAAVSKTKWIQILSTALLLWPGGHAHLESCWHSRRQIHQSRH